VFDVGSGDFGIVVEAAGAGDAAAAVVGGVRVFVIGAFVGVIGDSKFIGVIEIVEEDDDGDVTRGPGVVGAAALSPLPLSSPFPPYVSVKGKLAR